ncbi:MAG: DUF4143 domain-containing protein [Mycoplasmataceae bacterium]|nr:DUF4143 domain-containing protein [Mycoplasmataceae bacterium]
MIDNNISECIKLNRDYVENIVSSNQRKNISKNTLDKILKELSRNICAESNITSISKNTQLSRETIYTYLDFLLDSNIIEYIYGWNTHIRSSANVKSLPKINFTDQSFAIAILNINEKKLYDDFNTLGFFFESFVIKQLNVFCSLTDKKIFYYRDSDNVEVDCVIEDSGGEWIAIEIKLGSVEGIENGKKIYKNFITN